MNTLAWLLILSALVLIRQVSKGRVLNLGEDLSDVFIAVASNDQAGLKEVLSRTGDGTEVTQAFDPLADGVANAVGGVSQGLLDTVGSTTEQFQNHLDTIQKDINSNIALWSIQLGHKAIGYRFGATGPDYYDCSGLMWRACQKVGFKGGRFNTTSILVRKEFKRLADAKQAVTGDIVLWPTHHMGVVTTPGRFYSARSVKSGIGETNIEGFRKGSKPVYLRYIKGG